LSATCLALISLMSAASAQSLEAFQGDYAGNDGAFFGINGYSGADNASNPFTDTESFTGMDSMGNQQTETLNATAYSSATYGSATAYGSGTVTNPYYNAANPAYFDGTTFDPNGSPDLLSSHGNAGWSDTLIFSGVASTDQISFIFNLTGSGSGPIAAGINFTTDSAGGTYYGNSTTSTSAQWVTPFYALNSGNELEFGVDYYAGMTSYTSQMPEGVTYTGSFLSYLNLTGIEVTDANGNLVTGWSAQAASGTTYPQAVPEPTGFLIFGMGLAGVLLRRKR
jgi:hypothetical protein